MPGHRTILWLLPLIGGVGCVERTMTLTSDPPGALVYLNGQEVGRTPITRDFTWYGNYDVELRKEGYETLKTHSWVVAPWWQWVPIDLAADVMPFRLQDQQRLNYALAAASTQPTDPQALLRRGQAMQGQLESSEYTKQPATQPTTQPSAK